MKLSKERIFSSFAVESNLKVPVPIGLSLYSYQIASIEYHLNSLNYRTLYAHPPGTGKTPITIGICNYFEHKKILCIVPSSLGINWTREIKKWSTIPNLVIQRITKSKDVINKDANFIVVSFALATSECIYNQLMKEEFDLICIDEVHYLKNTKSQRTKACYGFRMKKGIISRGKQVVALSGTPFSNRPIELYSTIKALNHSSIQNRDWYAYAYRYCGAKLDFMNHLDVSGASNQKELGLCLRSSFMSRCRKEIVLKDLPPFSVRLIYLDKDKEASTLIKRMSKFSIDDLGRGVGVSADGISSDRKALGITKIQTSLSYIKNQLESGREKIIVFAHHREVIEQLYENLSDYNAVRLYGGMNDIDKDAAVNNLQYNPSCRVFIGSITAAGVGLTLTSASYVCFVECSYVPGENKQAMDRAHRIGQKENVEVEFLVYENSLDENIIKAHIEKNNVIKEIFFD